MATIEGGVITLGYVVATFSFGRLVVTSPLGYICDTYRHRLTLLVVNAVLVLGAILWANVYATKSLWCLFLAQFVMGIGSGSLGVTRSFAVEQVPQRERTNVLAVLTALQYAGFTVSPVMGSLLAAVGGRMGPYWVYALPGYVVGLLALLCIAGLLWVFHDLPAAAGYGRVPLVPSAADTSAGESVFGPAHMLAQAHVRGYGSSGHSFSLDSAEGKAAAASLPVVVSAAHSPGRDVRRGGGKHRAANDDGGYSDVDGDNRPKLPAPDEDGAVPSAFSLNIGVSIDCDDVAEAQLAANLVSATADEF